MSRRDIVVIPHGSSEVVLAKSIKKALKLPIEVFDPFKGKHDIAIGNITEVMDSYGFANEKELHKTFPVLQFNPYGNPKMRDLVIFPILDIDSYRNEKKAYITGNLFRNSPFADRIHPIFNDGNLDEILLGLGYRISTAGANKITTYHAVFDHMMAQEFETLSEKLKTVSDKTNLHIFIDFCLSQRPEYQGKVEPPF